MLLVWWHQPVGPERGHGLGCALPQRLDSGDEVWLWAGDNPGWAHLLPTPRTREGIREQDLPRLMLPDPKELGDGFCRDPPTGAAPTGVARGRARERALCQVERISRCQRRYPLALYTPSYRLSSAMVGLAPLAIPIGWYIE